MNVTIWSHFRDETWTGNVQEIEREQLGAILTGDTNKINSLIFRLFNRVDDADSERLEARRYRLPSLSVDDRITWGGRTFRVADVGFEELGL